MFLTKNCNKHALNMAYKLMVDLVLEDKIIEGK
jgi:hypothetical protein